jgi:hypothetical protein
MNNLFSKEETMKLLNYCMVDKRFESRNKSKIERFLKKLSEFGWFIENFDTISNKEISKIFDLLYSNQIENINMYLINYLKENFEPIKQRIICKNPKRIEILNEAFKNIQDKRFFSAIVLLITQIDGICEDHYGEKFFLNDSKNNYSPKVFKKLQFEMLEQHHFLTNCIEGKSPINIHQAELGKFTIKLNRHEIIHGVDVNYGNELNAFKIFSMIAYLNKTLELKI